MIAFLSKNLLPVIALWLIMALTFLQGCSVPKESKAVYVLVDVTYQNNQQSNKVIEAVRHLLNSLKPGESIALARIDSKNFNTNEIVAHMKFDLRPSIANAQKRAFLESIERFCRNVDNRKKSDITGGILHAIEYLNGTQASHAYILVFSDLQLKTKKDYFQNFSINFSGIHVIAMNVGALKKDSKASKKHLKSVKQWAKHVESGKGNWTLIDEVQDLDEIIK